MCLQRSQQNGRYGLLASKRLGPPQVGQVTMREGRVASGIALRAQSGAKGQFERAIIGTGLKTVIRLLAHQAD